MTTQITNEDIVQLFNNMAAMLEIKGDTVFKIRAYQRAANTINQISLVVPSTRPSADGDRPEEGSRHRQGHLRQDSRVRGPPAAMATYQRTGLDELPRRRPPDNRPVPGIGPKTVKASSPTSIGIGEHHRGAGAGHPAVGRLAGTTAPVWAPTLRGTTSSASIQSLRSRKDQRTPIGDCPGRHAEGVVDRPAGGRLSPAWSSLYPGGQRSAAGRRPSGT